MTAKQQCETEALLDLGPTFYGCLDCGALWDSLTDGDRCPYCGSQDIYRVEEEDCIFNGDDERLPF